MGFRDLPMVFILTLFDTPNLMVVATGAMIKQSRNRIDWPAYIIVHFSTNKIICWGNEEENVKMIEEYEYYDYLKFMLTHYPEYHIED